MTNDTATETQYNIFIILDKYAEMAYNSIIKIGKLNSLKRVQRKGEKMSKKNYYFVMNWDKFRYLASDDAYSWLESGYTAKELTISDITNTYPKFEDFERETENNYEIKVFETEEEAENFCETYRDDFYYVFSLEEIAEKTIEYLKEETE